MISSNHQDFYSKNFAILDILKGFQIFKENTRKNMLSQIKQGKIFNIDTHLFKRQKMLPLQNMYINNKYIKKIYIVSIDLLKTLYYVILITIKVIVFFC